jgi:hypothetical protein
LISGDSQNQKFSLKQINCSRGRSLRVLATVTKLEISAIFTFGQPASFITESDSCGNGNAIEIDGQLAKAHSLER